MEPEQKKALDIFLADNPELEQLSARLATFNIFKALKIEQAEIRHSNALGWLLDPAESHGLGDVFLRRILSSILLDATVPFDGLSAAQVELMKFGDIEVRREWKHIDLLVIDRGNHLVLLIENKIGSGEGIGQLARYRKVVNSEFPASVFMIIPVFLTLQGQASEDDDGENYLSYSHAQLLAVLERVVEQRRQQMPEAVATFLSHYMDTLRRLTMHDDELINLCKTIYRRHRAAIDLIAQYGMTSSFNAHATATLKQHACEILYSGPRMLYFIPDSWAKIVPANCTAWGKWITRPVSVVCWIEQGEKRIRLVFEVARMNDPQLRLKCVRRLSDAGFAPTKAAYKEDATYSRFHSLNISFNDRGDEDEVKDAVEKLVAKAKEHFPKVEAVLADVFKEMV